MPPIGAPKATETPVAAAAERISRFRASLLPYFGNSSRRPNESFDENEDPDRLNLTREKISATAGNMYERSFFADDQTSTGRKDHANTFDNKRPFTQIAVHDEPGENRLDLRNPRSTGVRS